MKPVNRYVKYAGLGTLFLMPVFFLLFFHSGDHQFVRLPYYGAKEPVYKADGTTDTLYHNIPSFSLIDQNGEVFTRDSLEGKIYVANFIFTTCPSICPDMTHKMVRLQWKLDDPAYEDVMLVSHTVDPEHDTVAVLKEYARTHEADEDRWVFLTGDKEDIYRLGSEGYYLAASEDVLAPGGFLHSEKFVLVDKQNHIRGFYNGTDLEEVDRLFDEIRMLMKEEKILRKKQEEEHD